jgi:signal transduction histidine kinase
MRVGTLIRGRVDAPSRVPAWGQVGAALFVAGPAAWSVADTGSSLALPARAACAAVLVAAWFPGVAERLALVPFALATLAPVAVLTCTGGSPLLFGAAALLTLRLALCAPAAPTVAVLLAGAALVLGRHFVAGHDTDWWMWKTYLELGALAGIALQRQQRRIDETRVSSADKARAAVLDERRRIARDVHDVLAHTITVLMVHLNSARLSVHDDPAATAEILDEVAQHGRKCLEDIRRTVGLLSDSAAPNGELGAIEAAEAIEAAVASYRKAGLDIELRLDVEMAHMGRLALAPARVWGVGYRLVQESLANAAKHAGGARVDVRIGVDDAGLHVVCTNGLHPDVIVLELPRGGNGVAGMRERVEALGGTFSAGIDGRSWVVRADLPIADADARARSAPNLGRVS